MEWIKISDKLPNYGSTVLIIRSENGVFFEPDIAKFIDGEFTPTVGDIKGFNAHMIHHWMPLPLAPSQKE